jgi:hypothetical protein
MRTSVGIGSLFVIAVLAGCGGHHSRASAPTGQASRSVATRCPVTLPRPWTPPPGVPQRALFGSDYASGNGRLWVGGLWPSGVIVARPQLDGSVGMKFGWWRNIPGHLRITGRRLDANAPSLRATVPYGYGVTGFQSSGVYFPTAGCWQVTGKAGTATVTFVTMVVKQAI